MAVDCPHPRPKLELPGRTPERQRWSPPTYIPNLDPNASRVIQEALKGIYAELARQLARSTVVPLIEDLQALDGQTIVGVGDGQTVTLPQPLDDGTVGSVRFVLDEVTTPVTVVNPDGSTYTLDQPGIYDVAIVPGTQSWTANAGVSSSGSSSGAGYLVDAAHGSLPNARVATDSTEVDVDTTVANVVSWALRTASVVFGKLADLTGLSVLGRASSSTGVMAAITSGSARHALMSDASNSAIAFRAITTADVPAHTWAEVLAAGATSGANDPIVDVGQFLQLGAVGPTANSPQIRSGDAILRMSGSAAVIVSGATSSQFRAEGGQCSIVGSTNAVLSATTAIAQIQGATGANVVGGTSAGVSATTGDTLINASTGNVNLTAPLGMVTVDKFLRITEQAASTPALSAGGGLHWVRSDTPNVPMFTDDTNTDNQLAYLSAVTALDWADVLAVDPTSGANNPIIATGQFLQVGNAAPAVSAQIKSAVTMTTGSDAGLTYSAGTSLFFNAVTTCTFNGPTGFNATASSGNCNFFAVATGLVTINVPLRQQERSASPTISAGQALWWTIDTTPNRPKWTDDTNTDFDIPLGVSSTSITWDTGTLTFQRAALSGAITAAANTNTTTYSGIRDNGTLRTARSFINAVSTTSNVFQVVDDAGNDELELQVQRAALTGDVTASQNSNSTTIANDVVTFAKMQNIATDRLVGRDTAGTGDPEEISLGASLEFSGSGSVQRAALTGDVTATANSNATTIANDAVSNAKLRNSGALSVIGRSANSTGDPADISATAATDAVLRESGSTLGFGTIATGGIADDAVTDAKLRNSGGISVIGRSANSTGSPADIGAVAGSDSVLRESGSTIAFGAIATNALNNGIVTNPKLADMAQSTIKGRAAGAGTGDPTDLTPTQARAVIETGALIRVTQGNTDSLTLALQSDTTWFIVETAAAGGGGGGADANSDAGTAVGGGGSSGGYVVVAHAVESGTLSINVGAVGTAGANTGGNGGNGGSTVLTYNAQTVTVNGGNGGTGRTGGAGGIFAIVAAGGASPGSNTVNANWVTLTNRSGMPGAAGFGLCGTVDADVKTGFGGNGGSTPIGGGGVGGTVETTTATASSAGSSASSGGGGGGGGAQASVNGTGVVGGTGGDPFWWVYEYSGPVPDFV